MSFKVTDFGTNRQSVCNYLFTTLGYDQDGLLILREQRRVAKVHYKFLLYGSVV